VRLEDDFRSGVRDSVAISSVAHARSERNRVVSMAMVSGSSVGCQGLCFIVLLRREAKHASSLKLDSNNIGPGNDASHRTRQN
jgi:hypothetical protein